MTSFLVMFMTLIVLLTAEQGKACMPKPPPPTGSYDNAPAGYLVELKSSLEDPKLAKGCPPDGYMWPLECNEYAPHYQLYGDQDPMFEEVVQPGLYRLEVALRSQSHPDDKWERRVIRRFDVSQTPRDLSVKLRDKNGKWLKIRIPVFARPDQRPDHDACPVGCANETCSSDDTFIKCSVSVPVAGKPNVVVSHITCGKETAYAMMLRSKMCEKQIVMKESQFVKLFKCEPSTQAEYEKQL